MLWKCSAMLIYLLHIESLILIFTYNCAASLSVFNVWFYSLLKLSKSQIFIFNLLLCCHVIWNLSICCGVMVSRFFVLWRKVFLIGAFLGSRFVRVCTWNVFQLSICILLKYAQALCIKIISCTYFPWFLIWAYLQGFQEMNMHSSTLCTSFVMHIL